MSIYPSHIHGFMTNYRIRIIGLVKLLCLGLFIFTNDAPVAHAAASGDERIVVIVNDEPITQFDVLAHTKFQLLLSGQLQDGDSLSAETVNGMRVAILRSLIQSKLILQEMKRRQVEVSDKEINDAIADMEQANNMKPGALFAKLDRNNLPHSVAIDSQKAQIGWPRTISRRIQAASRVSDSDIDEAIDSIKAAQGKTEYLLSEIVIIQKSDETADDAHERAEHALKRINQSSDFERLARGFSDSPSSFNGGDLGWIRQDQLDINISKILPNLAKNAVSGIIVTKNGLSIIKMRDKRENKNLPDQLSREQLQNHLFMQRLNSEGRRYLRELQFGAIIDVKQG
ncbi:MAG: peptidylprolyl isomerase [Alphaproteobacteria bacterium]|nr:peptidylprolyl isomerase [Alphaproteobacteria bacterium]